MYQEEEEVIHLDYNSEDEYDIPDDHDYDDDEESDDEAPKGGGESEAQLMEYLLKGLVLQSSTCGKCNTPLVKSLVVEENPKPINPKSKIEPIPNVPYCVSCCANVVTNQEELQVLWKDEYKAVMGIDGAVLLYMDEDVDGPAPVFGARNSRSIDDEAGIDMAEDEEQEQDAQEADEEEVEESAPVSGSSTRPESAGTTATENFVVTGDEEFNYDLIDYDKR